MGEHYKKKAWIDPSKRARQALDTILETTSEEAIKNEALQTSVDSELHKEPLVQKTENRAQSRVLFITRDVSVLEDRSMLQLHLVSLADTFSEIHVMVLCTATEAKKSTVRLAKNVWAYTTSVRFWSSQMGAALALARAQLLFTDGFRPDIVVALDPFESGLAGLQIAQKYEREFQVHVLENMFDPEFLGRDKRNKWRIRTAKHVLKRATSVRASTVSIMTQLQERFPHIADISLLPRHYDIQRLIQIAEVPQAADPFTQYVFKLLYVGKLDKESTLFRALDASRSILVSKSIGMLVLGDGPYLKEFQERARILGITEQVVFQKDVSKLVEYLAISNVLICTDTTEASDEIVIKAAAAGLPMVAARTPLREDLFTDGESAFLCAPEDTLEYSQKLVKFLNSSSLRVQFRERARDIVRSRLQEDPEVYKTAYRNSIEAVYADGLPGEINTSPKATKASGYAEEVPDQPLATTPA